VITATRVSALADESQSLDPPRRSNMTEVQAQILAAFNSLDGELKANTIKILVAAQRQKANAGASPSSCGFAVGDMVVCGPSTFVSKAYWGKQFRVAKIAPLHAYLEVPGATSESIDEEAAAE
jgi:hypothetical protein